MLKIKPFRQKYGYCGPASLKMVLDYYGVEKTEEELAKMSGCTAKQGVGLEKLLTSAKQLGFQGFIKEKANFTLIRQYIHKKQIPVIVDWFSVDDGHYSIVVDIDKENIYLQDPGLGYIRALRLSKFRRVWFDFPGEYLKSKKNLLLRRLMVIYPLQS